MSMHNCLSMRKKNLKALLYMCYLYIYLSWLPKFDTMKNTLRILFMTFSLCLGVAAYGQVGPNCAGEMNLPVDADGSATITFAYLIPNLATADGPVAISILNSYGGVITTVDDAQVTPDVTIPVCSHLSRGIMMQAQNAGGPCMTMITFKTDAGPIIEERDTSVFCGDPLIAPGQHIGGSPPLASVPCGEPIDAEFVADWIEVYECVLGSPDPIKLIVREYAAVDKFGARGTGKDSIYVYPLPEISRESAYCAERDTTYCEDDGPSGRFGPFMLVPEEVGSTECDTIWFIDPDGSLHEFDPKCGISTALKVDTFGQECTSTLKYTLEIKQTCYGEASACASQDVGGNVLDDAIAGYLRCEFWLMDLDTLGPTVYCDTSHFRELDGDTILIPTGSHDCAAHIALPPAFAKDSCNDVVMVKAMIEGYGSFEYSYNGTQWVSNSTVKIPFTESAIEVVYEAYDECWNVGTDTCYIRIKDRTKPVAVCDKGVNVSLTDKKVWVDASTFDEGSWDNCGIHLMLGRRWDWQTACVDLCDSLSVHSISHYDDTTFNVVLSEDKLEDPVEAHYAKAIEWLAGDGDECGERVAAGWEYDLIKYATVECKKQLTEKEFDDAFLEAHGSEYFEIASQIGGGWAPEVLFTCDDACGGPVSVELLVMDYWCNWSKCWTDVWVEDKTPIAVGKDVELSVEITCKTYRANSYSLGGEVASISDLVDAASQDDAEALDSLNAIFGGYQKAWTDPYGNFVDEEGDPLDCDITLIDSTCDCTTKTVTMPEVDEHSGTTTYVRKPVRECFYEEVVEPLTHGVVTVNCGKGVQCEQKVWYSLDECGQGYIYRKFKIYKGCPTTGTSPTAHAGHGGDTIFRIQQIWVGNECPLDRGMFSYPNDTILDLCGIEFDPLGSGNVVGAADPANIGAPKYNFDDDCRLVGIGHYDKVYRVVGGDEACYKIVRTWCFADWCGVGKPEGDSWMFGPVEPLIDVVGPIGPGVEGRRGKQFEYEQKIIVRDTVGPMCTITGPVADGGTIEAGGCDYDFSATLDVQDDCGLVSYEAILENITKGDEEVERWEGDLSTGTGNAILNAAGLTAGDYRLTAIVTDDCQNESICTYVFTVETGKKPSPICISSITVELTPWDTNGDGTIDTAAATVWAKEFNSSSSAPCGFDDDDLEFYIEFNTDADSATLDLDDDLDSLNVGCEHVGARQVRMWVLSPTGSADYCDVLLIVQNNMGGCGGISAQGSVTGSIATELNESVEQVNVKASLSDGTDLDFLTTSSGAYGFASTLGVDVTIEPVKDIEHDNGISTADMIQIQKHILGRSNLKNEYRLMAADVNNDGKITALDLLDIRRLILGKTSRFPNSNSWTFANSVDGQDTYTLRGVSGSMAVDFVGVKKGDVNVDNDPSRSARSAKNLVLQTMDQTLTAGNQYKVDITAGNFRDIEGYQYTLNFDAQSLKLVDVDIAEGLDLDEENFAFNAVAEGMIATSWHSAEAVEIASDEVLFTLVFDAKVDGMLSEVLTVNDKITDAEAYSSSNELLGVALEFLNEESLDASFTLYQNRPNPFKETTAIGFRLPETAATTLTVYDVTGKVLKVVTGEFQKGYNEVTMKKNDLNATGVLYYQLDSDTYTATRKMVIIE